MCAWWTCLYTQLCQHKGNKLPDLICMDEYIKYIRSDHIRAEVIKYVLDTQLMTGPKLSTELVGSSGRESHWADQVNVWLELYETAHKVGHKGAIVRVVIVETATLMMAGHLTVTCVCCGSNQRHWSMVKK